MSTCAAVLVLRRKLPNQERPFRIPGGSAIPLAALAIFGWVLSGSTRSQVTVSSAVLAGGACFYVLYAAIKKRARALAP
jgi:amino acid transporter